MKASELRIGNLINHKFSPPTFIVSVISTFNENSVNGIELDDCEGAPLTEEWLLKFGFSNITKICASKNVNIKTFCKTFRVGKCTEQQTLFVELGTRGWTFKRVGYPLYNYVHQLQNLYFALTNEELIYTP